MGARRGSLGPKEQERWWDLLLGGHLRASAHSHLGLGRTQPPEGLGQSPCRELSALPPHFPHPQTRWPQQRLLPGFSPVPPSGV